MAAKKRATKTPKKQSQPKKPVNNAKSKDRMMKILKNILFWVVLFVVSLVVVDYVVQYLNYHASIAVVNGERISRNDFYDELEAADGSSIASKMINEVLIGQAGKDEGVTITTEEIDEEIQVLEEKYDTYYGGDYSLDDALSESGMTRQDLKNQIEMTLIVKKILGSDIEVTDEEAQEYYDENKDTLYTDEGITFEDVKEEILTTIEENKLDDAATDWLATLQADANIQNNIDSPRGYSFLGITRDFFEGLFD